MQTMIRQTNIYVNKATTTWQWESIHESMYYSILCTLVTKYLFINFRRQSKLASFLFFSQDEWLPLHWMLILAADLQDIRSFPKMRCPLTLFKEHCKEDWKKIKLTWEHIQPLIPYELILYWEKCTLYWEKCLCRKWKKFSKFHACHFLLLPAPKTHQKNH